MAFVEVGRSRIYYEEYGQGTPIVLAHGVGGNHASWYRQVPTFARNNRVITFDHRGFGNSSDVEQVGQTNYVTDLLALLDALNIESAILVGQSMGGGTTATFTCTHPDRVIGLVVADSLAGLVAPEPLAGELMAHLDSKANLSQAERVLGPVARDDDPEHTLLYIQIASFNSVNIRTLRGERPQWTPQRLAETRVPVMFLVGQHDVLFPPEFVRRAQAMVEGSSFILVEGAGHSAYFERPAAFNRHVTKFISDLAPDRG